MTRVFRAPRLKAHEPWSDQCFGKASIVTWKDPQNCAASTQGEFSIEDIHKDYNSQFHGKSFAN
jgi:hypothetical protein